MSEINTGAIVERAVRRSGISIAELARRLSVNRRSVYYWFSQDSLSLKTVRKIGIVLGHDFSVNIPDWKNYDLDVRKVVYDTLKHQEDVNVAYWKAKYINLLEKYNQQLEQPVV